MIYIIYILKKYFFEPENYKNNIVFKLVSKIIGETYKVFIDNYCF